MRQRTSSIIASFITVLLLIQLIAPFHAFAAIARIKISNLYSETNLDKNLPAEDNNVPRFTENPITLQATIENIEEADIPNIYYEITNMNTKQTTVEKSVKPTKINTYEIMFDKVNLSEGLNMVVVKLGDAKVVSSSPAWVYFTPATSIENVEITDQSSSALTKTSTFNQDKIYPEDPSKSSALVVSGVAPNAQEVQVFQYGTDKPIAPFFQQGMFSITGDAASKKNSNANMILKAGENILTFIAKNDAKTYQITKNLIYDNGQPFVYNATLGEEINNELMDVSKGSDIYKTLKYENAMFDPLDPVNINNSRNSIRIYKDAEKTKPLTPTVDYLISKDTNKPSSTIITFKKTIVGILKEPVHVFYRTERRLSTIPNMVRSKVTLKSYLKDDLLANGNLKYKYMDVILNGAVKGTYQLTNAEKAPSLATSGVLKPVSPLSLLEGYSDFSLQVFGYNMMSVKDDLAQRVEVSLEDKNGVDPFEENTVFKGTAEKYYKLSNSKEVGLYRIPQGLTIANGPYRVLVRAGDQLLYEEQIQIVKPLTGDVPAILNNEDDDLYTASFKEGALPSQNEITFNKDISESPIVIEVTDLANLSTTPLAIPVTKLGDKITFSLDGTTLTEGLYRYTIKKNNEILTERYFEVLKPDPVGPTVPELTVPNEVQNLNTKTYLIVHGSNFSKKLSDLTYAGLYDGTTESSKLIPYAINANTMILRLDDPSKLTAGKTYSLKYAMRIRYPNGDLFTTDPNGKSFTLASFVTVVDPTVSYVGNYNAEKVRNISPLQLSDKELGSKTLLVEGEGLTKDVNLHALILSEKDGIYMDKATPVFESSKMKIFIPSTLKAGNYILRLTYGDNAKDDLNDNAYPVLAYYPFTIASPGSYTITPETNSTSELQNGQVMMYLNGSNIGRDPSKLKVKFIPTNQSGTGSTNMGIDISFSNNDSGITFSTSRAQKGITPVKGATKITMKTGWLAGHTIKIAGQTFTAKSGTTSKTKFDVSGNTAALIADQAYLAIMQNTTLTNKYDITNDGNGLLSFQQKADQISADQLDVQMTTPDTVKATQVFTGDDINQIAGQAEVLFTNGFINNDTITIDGQVFTASTGSTDANSFDVLYTTPAYVAEQLKNALEKNSTINQAYDVVHDGAGAITLTQASGSESPTALTVESTKTAQFDKALVTTGVQGVKEKCAVVVSGRVSEPKSIVVTVSGGNLDGTTVSTDSIMITKAMTSEQITTQIAAALEAVKAQTGFSASQPDLNKTTIILQQVTAKAVKTPLNLAIGGGGAIEENARVSFPIPTLSEGQYDVQLTYNEVPMGNAQKYQVTSPLNQLKENLSWSKPGRFKVFNFETDLNIGTDQVQSIEFEYYNIKGVDAVPTTQYYFKYKDPNLPYVDNIKKVVGNSEILLSETAENEVNEQPVSFVVYTNDNTKKVNLYLNQYTANTKPYMNAIRSNNAFKFNLTGLPNGVLKLVFVPTTDANTELNKLGENISGKLETTIKVTSTPYVILSNVYTGMVLKKPSEELTCAIGSATAGNCISGRFVNVPQNELTNIDMYLNNVRTRMAVEDFESLGTGKFNLLIGNDRIKELMPNSNNILRFVVNINGIPVTEAKYELFVVTSDTPQFVLLKPIETNEQLIKFTPDKDPDTYITTEKKVSFVGSFVNAVEIRLTVKTVSPDGTPTEVYDRRYTKYNNLFGESEPKSGNPNYFNTLNSPAGQFTTNLIPISKTGKTIFQFTIVDKNSVNVNRTLIITRQPPEYTIVFPKMTRNLAGQQQANINSNFIQVDLESEGADQILFNKTQPAIKYETLNENNETVIRYSYELQNLKTGKNVIPFTIVKGSNKTNYSFVLMNVGSVMEGAMFKTVMNSKISAFNNEVAISFPKGTALMKNDQAAVDPYISTERKVLVGLADQVDGRLDKVKYPTQSFEGKDRLEEKTGRFRPASQMIWVDAGTLSDSEQDMANAITGSGRNPYEGVRFYAREIPDYVIPTDRGTITIKYDPNLRGDSWRYLSIFGYDKYEDENGIVQYRWKNLGGIVDTKKKTITAPFEHFGFYQVKYMEKSFDDVIGHSWARNDMDTLYSKGYMKNKDLTSFGSSDPMTRGEFITMLIKLFDIPLNYSDTPTFTDVQRVNPLTNLYDYKYIETASKAGIIRGGGGGRFFPDKTISRSEAAIMISKAADLKLNTVAAKTLTNLQKLFTDANLIDPYAQFAVEAVAKAGFIQGRLNDTGGTVAKKPTYRFDPNDVFTRAESAHVGYLILINLKKIPY